jgi:hypothetical protein
MASAGLSRRIGMVVGYPALSQLSAEQRREFHEALLDADSFEDRPLFPEDAVARLPSGPAVVVATTALTVRSPNASATCPRDVSGS